MKNYANSIFRSRQSVSEVNYFAAGSFAFNFRFRDVKSYSDDFYADVSSLTNYLWVNCCETFGDMLKNICLLRIQNFNLEMFFYMI